MAAAAVALTATEVAWAPWTTGDTDEAINEPLITCPDGQEFELAAGGLSAVRPPAAGSPTIVDVVVYKNWDQYPPDRPPRSLILLAAEFPLEYRPFKVRRGSAQGWWPNYGVVTILWPSPLLTTDQVRLNFDRFDFDDSDNNYGPYDVGGPGCPLALDNRVQGDERPDVIIGNDASNELVGGDGDDFIAGRGGDDELFVGPGADKAAAGGGGDLVHTTANDGQVDEIDCGRGTDTVRVNSLESDVFVNCERVVVVTSADPHGD